MGHSACKPSYCFHLLGLVQLHLQLLPFCLGKLALGDIPKYAQYAHNPPILLLDGGLERLYPDFLSGVNVFFLYLFRLPRLQDALVVCAIFVHQLSGEKVVIGSSGDLIGCDSQVSCKVLVARDIGQLPVFDEYSLRNVLNQGSVFALAFAQRFLGPLALGNVKTYCNYCRLTLKQDNRDGKIQPFDLTAFGDDYVLVS